MEFVECCGEWLEWLCECDGVDGFSVGVVLVLCCFWWVGVVDDGGVECLGVYGEEECLLLDHVVVFL